MARRSQARAALSGSRMTTPGFVRSAAYRAPSCGPRYRLAMASRASRTPSAARVAPASIRTPANGGAVSNAMKTHLDEPQVERRLPWASGLSEHVAQLGRKGVRLTGPAVLAAQEAAVVTREDDRLLPESLGDGVAAPVRHLAL